MMRTIRPTALVVCCLFAVLAAGSPRAADAVFPPAARVGLAPPAGLTVSKEFVGFEDRARKTGILIIELPAAAYAEMEKSVTAELLKQGGTTLESNDPFPLNSGPAFLIVGRQQAEGLALRKWVLVASSPDLTAVVTVQVPEAESATYPDAAVRAALATLTVRANVPVEEQLGVLPFTLRDLAGFRIIRVLAGGAALLTEGPSDAIEFGEQPLMLITVVTGAPAEPAERDRFARGMFAGTPAIKDVRLTRAEPLRIGGQPGHEIVAEAKDLKGDTAVTVVQWLRFGIGGHLRLTGIARKDAWAAMFPRFRAVRDGVEPR